MITTASLSQTRGLMTLRVDYCDYLHSTLTGDCRVCLITPGDINNKYLSEMELNYYEKYEIKMYGIFM